MEGKDTPRKSLKQKVVHEFQEVGVLSAYLAFFFCALATYSMLLLGKFHNALVIAKVILIGEALPAGTKYEGKGLIYSAVWKSFVFSWLVFAFHIFEEMLKHLFIHPESDQSLASWTFWTDAGCCMRSRN